MSQGIADMMKLVGENDVKSAGFRFVDTRSRGQHASTPVSHFSEDKFESGRAFDSSSIAGWKGIEASGMLLVPGANTAHIDPFYEEPTLTLTCDVVELSDGRDYDRDPHSIVKRVEAHLKSTGLGDIAYFGPEPEFFIFDGMTWNIDMQGYFVKINSEETPWSSDKEFKHGNSGHRPGKKGDHFPVVPIDTFQDVRLEVCLILGSLGIPVEVHYHKVAGQDQNEIGTKFSTLVQRADWIQLQGYVIQNVAHTYDKTATLVPKPVVGDSGSGIHVHQSIRRDDQDLFAGNGYAGLSEFALYYIGGTIRHARVLNAFTNPDTNLYKRLVPGSEVPAKLACSTRNHSASIHTPYVANPKGRRIEAHFLDPLINPYLGFSTLLMAGLDGVQNEIHSGEAADKNLYDLPPEKDAKIPTVCSSLDQALEYLDKDRESLTRGRVFSNAMLDAYIELKMGEVARLRMATHPLEFKTYYSL